MSIVNKAIATGPRGRDDYFGATFSGSQNLVGNPDNHKKTYPQRQKTTPWNVSITLVHMVVEIGSLVQMASK